MSDAAYWLGFNLISGIGPARFRRLLNHFGTAEAAWRADGPHLAVAGLDSKSIESVVARRREIDLDRELARIDRAGVSFVTLNDPGYPPLLRHIGDAPALLYVSGDIRPGDELGLGVVGEGGEPDRV